ncbi:MAG: hypothetical protein HY674_05080 [Chloroflexi bacterium]|nr:hypothetical protein [Chloroflexota bacterium]
MKNKKAQPQVVTPEQLAEEEDLMRCCEAAGLALAQMLDREEAEAGCAVDYSSLVPRRRSARKQSVKSVKSVVKKGVEK